MSDVASILMPYVDGGFLTGTYLTGKKNFFGKEGKGDTAKKEEFNVTFTISRKEKHLLCVLKMRVVHHDLI